MQPGHQNMFVQREAFSSLRSGTCLIVNGRSGKREGSGRLDEFRNWVRRMPGPGAVEVVHKGSNLSAVARRAAEHGFSTVVAAGGDGTIAAVASALTGTETAMGVIPMGTFNFFARGLGIPDDPAEAMDVIEKGVIATTSPGVINDRIFLNNASLGAYPAILDQREGIYKRWGRSRIAAHWSTVKALLTVHRPQRMKVTVDGVVHRAKTPLAFVANSAFQLEQFQLEGADAMRDGKFALFLAEDCGRWKMLQFAARLGLGTMREGRDFELYCGKEIVIETEGRKRLVACDGEKQVIEGPFRFRRLDNALKVIVPGPTRTAA